MFRQAVGRCARRGARRSADHVGPQPCRFLVFHAAHYCFPIGQHRRYPAAVEPETRIAAAGHSTSSMTRMYSTSRPGRARTELERDESAKHATYVGTRRNGDLWDGCCDRPPASALVCASTARPPRRLAVLELRLAGVPSSFTTAAETYEQQRREDAARQFLDALFVATEHRDITKVVQSPRVGHRPGTGEHALRKRRRRGHVRRLCDRPARGVSTGGGQHPPSPDQSAQVDRRRLASNRSNSARPSFGDGVARLSER